MSDSDETKEGMKGRELPPKVARALERLGARHEEHRQRHEERHQRRTERLLRRAARNAGRHRTQEERRTETQARLLNATFDCLHRLGYANTSTVEVSKQAGVSRGGQLHHFPTKAALVTAAVEHVFERRHEEFRAALAELPASADRPAAAIDLLWRIVSGPTFLVWLELLVASRTDRELRQAVSEMDDRFGESVRQTFREIFPAYAAQGLDEVIPSFAFAVLEGIALGDILQNRERDRTARLLDIFKAVAQLLPSQSAQETES